jgi:hypothetical protein
MNTPTPLDPIAQLVAKYQANGYQTTAPDSPPAPRQKKDRLGFAGKTLTDHSARRSVA